MPSPTETISLVKRFLAGDDSRDSVSKVKTGNIFLGVKTIDMNDAQVALTLADVTGGILFVDANSSGTEDLLLPPEADCEGLVLIIVNTGGESIVVKDDGDSTTVVTIATTEMGIVACDGTTWRGGTMLPATPVE